MESSRDYNSNEKYVGEQLQRTSKEEKKRKRLIKASESKMIILLVIIKKDPTNYEITMGETDEEEGIKFCMSYPMSMASLLALSFPFPLTPP